LPLSVTTLEGSAVHCQCQAEAAFKPPLSSWLPLASRATRVTVAESPDMTWDADTVIVDLDRLTGPTTITVGSVEVTAWPPIVAVIVLLPALVPVKVAVYVPLPLSVAGTGLNVPLPVLKPKATFKPPLSSWLPLASRAVRVTVAVPPKAIGDGDTVIVDCDRLTTVQQLFCQAAVAATEVRITTVGRRDRVGTRAEAR